MPRAPKSTAVTKATPAVQLPANYDERVQNDISAFKNRLAVSESNKITVTQDKKFRLPGDGGTGEKVDRVSGIIIDFCAHKAYYETDFDRDNPVPPNCFALGFVAHDNLMPSDNSPDCQSEDGCRSCSRNQFTQTATGKWLPKSCKDSYTIALMAPDDDGKGTLMILGISSTAIKAFDKYIRDLANSGRAPYQVVTEFYFDPKSDYPSVRANFINDMPDEGMGLVMSVQDEAAKIISQEPKTDGFEEKVVAKRLPPPKAARGRK
jgi:hypothetical protein